MPKKQTRRGISVKGLTHQRLKDYCDGIGKSVSGYLEELIAADMEAKGVPAHTVLRPPPHRPERPKVAEKEEEIHSSFTF